ncbi:MAG: lasso peptide biosynthesis B2 protein [Pseudomonadota bacterium]
MNSSYPLLERIGLALRAVLLLAWARYLLPQTKPGDVFARNERAARLFRSKIVPASDSTARSECDMVAYAIPRIAARVPWRSDCLVQALAGQIWLSKSGVASEIKVGALKSEDGALQAHAVLACADQLILGGDLEGYEQFIMSAVDARSDLKRT